MCKSGEHHLRTDNPAICSRPGCRYVRDGRDCSVHIPGSTGAAIGRGKGDPRPVHAR